MNFGFMTAAVVLMTLAFTVAKSHEEVIENTPPSRGIIASFHGAKRHHLKVADNPQALPHSTVAALNHESDRSLR